MNKRSVVLLTILLSLPVLTPALGLTSSTTGLSDTAFTSQKKGETDRSEKKTPGFIFNRPAMTNAEAQLAYADRLAQEKKTGKAIDEYDAFVHEWHSSSNAPAAQLALATLMEEAGRNTEAFTEFQYLVEYFPHHFNLADVLDHQFRIANTVMTEKHYRLYFFRGIAVPERALSLFEKMLKNGRQWEKAPQVQWNIGIIYEQKGSFLDAISAYEEIQSRYPASEYSEEAAFRRAQCLYMLAEASSRDEVSCRDALSALSMCIRDYPRNPNADEARKRLGELKERLADMYYERALFYDKTARRPQSAVIMYSAFIRNFPSSRRLMEVTKRLDALKTELEKKNEK